MVQKTKTPKTRVALPDSLIERVQRFATRHHKSVEETLTSLLEKALDEGEVGDEVVDWSQPDPTMDREMEAYISLHPILKEQYFGKYVAVYHGELVDYDIDSAALLARIEEKYPNEFVWLSEVGPEPIETIVVRSPRLVRN